MVTANPAGEAVLRSAQIAASNTGMLKFGSAECDARFMGAVRQAMGRGAYRRAVLRQRDGGWLAVEVHGARGDDVVLVGLKEELSPSAEALDAIGAAFQLTSSELAVLRCLLGGRCPKSAANDLSISEHTVRAHLRSIYSKMNVRGLNNTIRLACSFL
ncbi:MAG: helix-turn-helix transcriptional regulator [Pseudomonadota bacterium]